LEDRLAPAAHDTLATAVPLPPWDNNNQTEVGGILTAVNQVDMYSVSLNAGDEITVNVTAQQQRALESYLRIFDSRGQQVASQANMGSPETARRFDVLAAGVYYVGISSNGNTRYDPNTSGSGSGGFTAGVYTLMLARSTFVPPYQALPVGSSPDSVAVGDFNHDGNPDIVTVNDTDSTVSVVLGRGDGTFRSVVSYPVGLLPTSVAVGDFNHDGNSDIVTANNGDSTVSVLLGRGDGTFLSAASYPVGLFLGFFEFKFSVAVGDFNHDGNADIVTALNGFFDTVSVLLGRGDGTFLSAVAYPVGSFTTAVAVGDFNHDGNPDIVNADAFDVFSANGFFGTVSVLLGRGDGTFLSAVAYAVGDRPESVAVGDFNHDGKLDIVAANVADNTVSVLLGRGDGTFLSAVAYTVGDLPESVAVGDFNNDRDPDIVTANADDNTVSVLLNQGGGQFQGAPAKEIVLLSGVVVSAATAGVSSSLAVEFLIAATNQFARVSSTNQFVSTIPVGSPVLALGIKFTEITITVLPDTSGALEPNSPASGFVDQPSALQVLNQGNNLDVYLTYRGAQLPINIVEVSASAAVAQGTNLPGGDLVLVATLLSGRLMEPVTATRTGAVPGEQAFALFVPPTALPGRGLVEIVGEVGGAPVLGPQPQAAGWESFPLGAGQALRQRLQRQQAGDQLESLWDGFTGVLDQFRRWFISTTSLPAIPQAGCWHRREEVPLTERADLAAAVFALGLFLLPGSKEKSTRSTFTPSNSQKESPGCRNPQRWGEPGALPGARKPSS
jgi:hypothetical protein